MRSPCLLTWPQVIRWVKQWPLLKKCNNELQLPAEIELSFQGAAEAFRRITQQHVMAGAGGGADHVHSAGHFVRKFNSPCHDFIHFTFSDSGRLIGAAVDEPATGFNCCDWHSPADRSGEENGIMMVDFALEAQRNQGLTPREAIYQAALLRFRPILMTTLAALFGAVPLLLASGSGAELRQPLGLVMVGGLIVSQVLTLFTTPVVYLWFDRHFSRPPAPATARRWQI